MTASKYKRSLNKKLNSEHHAALSSLRKENAYWKTLVELSIQQQYKLVESFLSLEMLRLESSQQAADEPLDQNKESSVDGDSSSCEQSSNTDEEVTELRNQLKDALEKNQQWLEYDQQREAYVKAILDKMSWLEDQLNEANQARSQQHNEAHSDGELERRRAADTHQTVTRETERMSQMQDHYEKLLQKAREGLEALREQVDATRQDLMITQSRCQEKEDEVEELRQQLESERKSRGEQDDHDASELSDESEDRQTSLNMEQRRSDSFGMQAKVCQKFKLYHQVAEQKKIEELQRQIKISSEDLEDERQKCCYLKRQLVRVLKIRPKNEENATEQTKRQHQAHSPYEEALPNSKFTAGGVTSTAQRNMLDESFLECPKCQVEYPTSRYRELLTHIDICLA